MLGEPHSIHHEFPQHRERIDALVREHPDFRAKVEEHDRLDKRIRGLEMRENPIADRDMETMKVERMHLKDEIYRRLNGG
ncbi:MAG TPA: YdcH family protein [Alcanivorax sp.]|nr:YdcH family protein [Alcanivorax sp.]